MPFHILLFFFFFFPFLSTSLTFDITTITLSNLLLLGDAHFLNGTTLRLTADAVVPTASVGRAVYTLPIRPSFPFSTFFSFSVSTLNPSSLGAGLAFVLTSTSKSLGSAGPTIGILPSASPVFAVEFDTLMDPQFDDPNGNHVGVDLGSMVSEVTADLDLVDVDLKSGDLINAWIEYDGLVIKVYVSYETEKPEMAVVEYEVDLGGFFEKDLAYVGFSAATQASTEVHSIEWWNFSSKYASTPPPPPSVFNVTAPAPPVVATVPAPESPKNASVTTALSPRISQRNRTHAPAAIAGAASAGTLLMLAFAGVGFWFLYTRRRRKRVPNSFEATPAVLVNGPKEFSYRQLSAATRNFSCSRVIGHGAFGTVYKGIVPETGAMIAVKRCIRDTDVGRAEFLSELTIIAGLRHRNLLRLHGWCHEKNEILLVYDYMLHGSLDKALFDPETSLLPWPHRKRILLGIASALAYLHRECERKVIHRDVKSSNVMLDENYNARLGDFGLARQLDHDASPDATVTAGTMGYLAPEYLLTGRATEKTDVFSFGAVVLEVVSGRRPIDGPSKRYRNLVEWVWGLHSEGRLLEAVDVRLESDYDEAEMRRVILIGLACSSPDPATRPGMRAVVQMLSGETEAPVVPVTKPSMSIGASNEHLLLSLQDSLSDCNVTTGFNVYSSDSSSDSMESTLRGGVERGSSGSHG